MPSLFWPIILLLLVVASVVVTYFILQAKKKGVVTRALNMSLFLVRVPKGEAPEGKQEKDLISVGEQLLAGFHNLSDKGMGQIIYGAPYIALEMAVDDVGEETSFYISVPRDFEAVAEKQVHSFYPDAEIERVRDYNIFNPQGASAGAVVSMTQDQLLPFQTYQHLPADPVSSLLNSMSKLQADGEGAAVQILLQPSQGKTELATKVAQEIQAGYAFKEALSRAKGKKKKEEEEANKQRPQAAPADLEIAKLMQEKAAKVNYNVNVRLVASAGDQARADQILAEMEGAIAQYGAPSMNSLKTTRMKGAALEKLFYNFSFRIFDNSKSMQMSTEEVTSLYHFPTPLTAAPKVKQVKAKGAEPPVNLPTEGVMLGKNIFRGQETMIKLAPDDRRRHLYIIGQTGTGKTTLLKNMIVQDIEAGKGVCYIDPHGQEAEYILSIIPENRKDDVIYFSPGDVERPLGLNMLEIDPSKPEQKTFVTDELLAILKSIYPDVGEAFGPMFEQYFKNSVLLLLDDYATEVPTLAEIPRVLADADYRRDKLSREANPLVKNFWEQEAEKAGGEASLANMVPYITSKLNPFLSNEYLRPIIGQQKSAFNFREALDSNKILIVNLNKGKIGDTNANLLGSMVVGKLLMAALSRTDIEENQRNDFYLFIDEFQNFTTDSISTILSEARKYKLNLIIAHQFIAQLKDSIRDAVFGNVGSMVAYRVGNEDADFLKNQFAPVFSENDLSNIDNFNAHVKLLVNNQTTNPFNIKVDRGKEGSAEVKDSVKSLALEKYGRNREDVEREISTRLRL
jgi:hypothetical protein